jgi:hypothetical protein
LAAQPEEIRIFSGEPRLLVVHGYSTSQHWWAFLQRKIDRYSGGADRRVVEVQLCNKGGTPIARWMNLESGQRTEAWTQMLTPMIEAEKGERPVIVLAQQSLQFVYLGDRRNGIRNEQDDERIKIGADAIQRYAELIFEDGADAVVIGMHIFKHSMEPEIGNERLALAALMKRKPPRIGTGPDTWKPTRQNFPSAFDRDKLHPNFIGAEIMAHYWFDALLKREGLETPAWSEQEMNDAIKNQPMGTTRDRVLFSAKLKEWKIPERAPSRRVRNRTP